MALDEKDMRIMYELDKDARMSLVELARKVNLSKEVVHYRMRNLKRDGYITKFYTIINTAKLGYVSFKIYLQFQNMNRDIENELLRYLQAHPQVFWIGRTNGIWDLMVGTWALHTVDFYDSVLQDILNKFSDYISNKAITISTANIQQNRRWIDPDEKKEKPITSYVGGAPETDVADEIDLKILRVIANNARMTIKEIAKRANTTESIVNYRLKQLKNQNIIQSFRIGIDLNKLNYVFCKALLYLKNFTTHKQDELVRYCKEHKNILNVVSCVGSWDMEIEIEAENFQKFHDIMKELRENFSDTIKNYESAIISDEPKVDFIPKCAPPEKM